MKTPMPSPRGTNVEGLTLPGAVAAYDAAPDGDRMKKVADFLGERMTPEDVKAVLAMMTDEDDDPDDTGGKTDMASDAGFRSGVMRDFENGRINSVVRDQLLRRGPGTPTTADRTSFASRFPDAAKIKQAY